MKRSKLSIGIIWLMVVLLALPASGVAAQDDLVLTINIKPDKDPNVVNVKQPMLLPVAIYYGDYAINEASVTLQGVPVSEWLYKSGYLLVKFNTQAVVATLGTVRDGEVYQLTLRGLLKDGTPFVGYDTIVIVKRGR